MDECLDFPSTSIVSRDQPLLHSKSLKTWLGGARRDRTDDLLLAKQALSQLSYGPGQDAKVKRLKSGGPGKTRTSDLTLIKRAL